MCRSCLMHQVTNRLSAMEQATMKCTRQVTKTLTVPVRREVHQLPLQWMRIQGRRNQTGTSDGLIDVDPPIQSVIGPNGLREFILLPLWTVNDFISKIKETHFKTLRDKYQIPDKIPMRLPYKSKKCYYEGLEDLGIYEQMLKAGLRFPLSTLHCHLL